MNKTITIFITLILLTQLCYAQQKKYEPNWESLDSRPVAPWFENAKFGIFIHWGPYSVPAWSPKGTYSEWYQFWLQTKSLFGNGKFSGTEVYDHHVKTFGIDFTYYQFGEMFTNDLFNPDDWVNLFQQSGAKYIVTTTKHHDGYCMWPSKEANDRGFPWNSAEVGAKRDIVGELTKSMRKTDLKVGFYYSLYEWFHPWWKNDKERFVDEHFHPQFKDLIERYQPDVIWGDGEWDLTAEKWKTPQLMAWLFNESSVKDKIVINDRWGAGIRKKHGGYFTTEYESSAQFDKPWEECRGMGFSFGYNRNEDAQDYNSPQTLILMLMDIVSNGGNLLLDIGPDARGRIPVIMQERLLQMGKWLKTYGKAVYGTEKWKTPVQWSEGDRNYKPEGQHYLGGDFILKQTVDPEPSYAAKQIFFTFKENMLYAVTPRWPGKNLVIKNFSAVPGCEIKFLGTGESLSWENKDNNLVIKMPEFDPNSLKPEEMYAYAFSISDVKDFVRMPQINVKYFGLKRSPEVTVSCPTENAEIYYTLDGSCPSKDSQHYNKTVIINKSGTFKAKAFRKDLEPSHVISEDITAVDKYSDIILENAPAARYTAKGVISLADDVRGTVEIKDESWLGFEKTDFKAVVDLGEKKAISAVKAGCLSNQNSWVFFPQRTEFFSSDDGVDFNKIKETKYNISKKSQAEIRDFSAEFKGIKARFIKIKLTSQGRCPDWHKGAGGKAWLFVDEIIIN